jgi:P27 family predicted phage terminase small subunit
LPAHRKPTALKILHGSRKSTINDSEPKFTAGTAQCPEWLHPLAKEEWYRLMEGFGETRLVTGPDQATLAAYCQSYARWVQAEQDVEQRGQLIQEPIVTRSGNISGYRWKKNPSVTVAKDERACMIAAGRLFGLNPSSRASISLPDTTPDELQRWLDGEADDDLFVKPTDAKREPTY